MNRPLLQLGPISKATVAPVFNRWKMLLRGFVGSQHAISTSLFGVVVRLSRYLSFRVRWPLAGPSV
jgi:hypothetical protein